MSLDPLSGQLFHALVKLIDGGERRLYALILLVSALTTIPVALAHAHSFVPKNFDQLVAEADQIFVGTGIAAQSRRLPTGAIVTDVTFSNLQVLKGSDVASELVLMVLGGTVEGETLAVAGFPEFKQGVEYLIFSKDNGRAVFPAVGGDQGVFQVQRDPSTGDALVFDAHGAEVTSSTVRDAVNAQVLARGDVRLPPRLTLDAFVRAITDRLRQ